MPSHQVQQDNRNPAFTYFYPPSLLKPPPLRLVKIDESATTMEVGDLSFALALASSNSSPTFLRALLMCLPRGEEGGEVVREKEAHRKS